MEVVEMAKVVLSQFADEAMGILLAASALLFVIFIAYWLYNRRKFHKFSHQIPAVVVKNYLDTIIFNSNALKSSLFRGGGLEGIPSVIPSNEWPSLQEGAAPPSGDIDSLKRELEEKDKTVRELEVMINSEGAREEELEEENKKLKAELQSFQGGQGQQGGGEEFEKIAKERDKLKERLMEYEIIEEDLANLKKFQEENKELRANLEKLQQSSSEADVSNEAKEEEMPAKNADPESIVEEEEDENKPNLSLVSEEESKEISEDSSNEEASKETSENAASEEVPEEIPEIPLRETKQKSAEELLSEFEKMLG